MASSPTDLERATALSDAAERAQPLSSPAGAKARRASMAPKASSSAGASSSTAATRAAPRHSMPASSHQGSSTGRAPQQQPIVPRKSIGVAKDGVSSGDSAGPSAPVVQEPAPPAADISAQSVGDESQRPNVRLQRLGEALEKFLTLLDHKMTPEAVRKAFPKLDAAVLESARGQFIHELKDVIKAEKDTLVEQYDLSARLMELQDLADEAMERDAKGLQPGDEEVKDAWRPDLDIATAVRARAVPVQRERVGRLKGMLDELEKENAALQEQLRGTTAKATEKQRRAKLVLDQLDAASASLEVTPEMDSRLRSAMDALLAELGPNATAGLSLGAKRGRDEGLA